MVSLVTLLVLAWAAATAAMIFKSRLNYLALPELERRDVAPEGLTVIIPARNEGHQIDRAIRGFEGLRVVVVDDGSEDDTAEVAREAGAEVIAAPPLAKGWKGKPNACLAGARAASTDWLLFVDADTWFDPAFAASVVHYAEREGLDAVTVFLHQHCVSFAERMLLPYALGLYFTGVSALGVNDPDSEEALANGQCLLFRRSAYEAIGGHERVADSVIEDVALARELKRNRVPFRVLRTEALGHVRMYSSFEELWRGFEKNSFRFLLVNPWSGLQVVLASVMLTSWLPLAILSGGESALAGILALVPVLAFWGWYGGASALWVPVAVYVFQGIALTAMFRTLTGIGSIWKGRRV